VANIVGRFPKTRSSCKHSDQLSSEKQLRDEKSLHYLSAADCGAYTLCPRGSAGKWAMGPWSKATILVYQYWNIARRRLNHDMCMLYSDTTSLPCLPSFQANTGRLQHLCSLGHCLFSRCDLFLGFPDLEVRSSSSQQVFRPTPVLVQLARVIQ